MKRGSRRNVYDRDFVRGTNVGEAVYDHFYENDPVDLTKTRRAKGGAK
jgi:hypothetical protein